MVGHHSLKGIVGLWPLFCLLLPGYEVSVSDPPPAPTKLYCLSIDPEATEPIDHGLEPPKL